MIALVIALIGFSILAFKKPVIALSLILFILPSYLIRLKIGNFPTTFLELMVVMFILSVLARLGPKKIYQQTKKLGRFNWLIGLFVLSGIISIFVSPETLKAAGAFKAFILEPVLFFYATISILRKKDDFKVPLLSLLLSSTLVSAFGLLQYFTLLGLPTRFWGFGFETRRITSVFEYPNALALFLAPILSFYFCLVITKDRLLPYRKIVFFSLLVIFASLLLTFSRGALLAMVLSIIPLWGYFSKKQKIAGLLLFAVILIIPQITLRVKTIFSDPSSIAHVDLMKAAINKIETSPLLGNGLNGFRQALVSQNFAGEILNYPHNIFLNFWLELGILGLLSFLAIVTLCFRQYFKQKSGLRFAAVLALAAMLIHGLVDVPYFKNDLSLLFWFIISVFWIEE